jgi:hypothetical protein
MLSGSQKDRRPHEEGVGPEMLSLAGFVRGLLVFVGLYVKRLMAQESTKCSG